MVSFNIRSTIFSSPSWCIQARRKILRAIWMLCVEGNLHNKYVQQGVSVMKSTFTKSLFLVFKERGYGTTNLYWHVFDMCCPQDSKVYQKMMKEEGRHQTSCVHSSRQICNQLHQETNLWQKGGQAHQKVNNYNSNLRRDYGLIIWQCSPNLHQNIETQLSLGMIEKSLMYSA